TVFAEQRARRFDVWRDPFVTLRIPKIFHLRRDPFERADTDSNGYNLWWDKKVAPAAGMARVAVSRFVQSLQAFPPRQRPGTFTVDQIMESLYQPKAQPPK
ncbi:MAG: arylsulfatase, partial [Pseudomonadota bacterium]